MFSDHLLQISNEKKLWYLSKSIEVYTTLNYWNSVPCLSSTIYAHLQTAAVIIQAHQTKLAETTIFNFVEKITDQKSGCDKKAKETPWINSYRPSQVTHIELQHFSYIKLQVMASNK